MLSLFFSLQVQAEAVFVEGYWVEKETLFSFFCTTDQELKQLLHKKVLTLTDETAFYSARAEVQKFLKNSEAMISQLPSWETDELCHLSSELSELETACLDASGGTIDLLRVNKICTL